MFDPVLRLFDLGGPVVMVLLALSVISMSAAIYKLWQFRRTGVGRHEGLRAVLASWDSGDHAGSADALAQSHSYLAPVLKICLSQAPQDRARSEAEARFARLEKGMRLLDTIAQISPLLGLFGTVLGMIEAFQSLQAAGAQVDPSLLAGGIWVALLTTAVGLAVAMPTSLVHTWLEGRLDRDRVLAEWAIAVASSQASRARQSQ